MRRAARNTLPPQCEGFVELAIRSGVGPEGNSDEPSKCGRALVADTPFALREKTALRGSMQVHKREPGSVGEGCGHPRDVRPRKKRLEPGSRRPQKTYESSHLGWTATARAAVRRTFRCGTARRPERARIPYPRRWGTRSRRTARRRTHRFIDDQRDPPLRVLGDAVALLTCEHGAPAGKAD